MSVTRVVARPLLASIFVAGGIDEVRNPETKVKAAEKLAQPLAQKVPGLPQDTASLVRINGALQIGAGVLLAIGKLRRLAALALIGSVVPTTLAGHRFWEETDDSSKKQQQIHFLKNAGLLGGLILAAVDTEGKPSLGWRARRGAKRARQAVGVGRESGAAVVAQGSRRAVKKANQAAAKAAAKANQIDIQAAAKSAKKAAKRGSQTVAPLLQTGADRASDLADRAGDLLSKASEKLPVG